MSDWPNGDYGLLSTFYGCPGHGWGQPWGTAYIRFYLSMGDGNMTLEHDHSYIHMNDVDNSMSSSVSLTLTLCLREEDEQKTGKTEEQWPRGSYCVLKKTVPCLTGIVLIGKIVYSNSATPQTDTNIIVARFKIEIVWTVYNSMTLYNSYGASLV